MIYNLEDYENFIKSILRRVPICRTMQLILALCNTYKGLSEELAAQILLGVQRRGYVVLSPDGWAMTKGAVQNLTQQKFNENYIEDLQYRLPSMDKLIRKSKLNFDTLDCLWIAIDMMPDAENFILTDSPWNISFDILPNENTKGKLFQITKIPARSEEMRCELIRNLPRISFDQYKEIVNRIALIEDERHAWMVPHVGFSHICVIDESSPRMFKVIEKREGDDIWSEA